MNGTWYKSTPVKAVWIALCHIGAAGMAVLLAWMLCYPAVTEELFDGEGAARYEDSARFQGKVTDAANLLLERIAAGELFETDGVYDPEKLVDIETFYQEGSISGNNDSGLAYRLGDLLSWNTQEQDDSEETAGDIIVCIRADGTYFYDTYTDFQEKILDGTLSFAAAEEDTEISAQAENENSLTAGEFLEAMQGGWTYEEYAASEGMDTQGIQDGNGQILYLDCWLYNGSSIEESYAPDGFDSLPALANEDERWNGRLEDAYEELGIVIGELEEAYGAYENLDSAYEEGTTNLTFLYADNEKTVTNRAAYAEAENPENSLAQMKEKGKYILVRPQAEQTESNLSLADPEEWCEMVKNALSAQAQESGDGETYVFALAVDTSYPVGDTFSSDASYYDAHVKEIPVMLACGIAGAALFLIGLVWLTITAGRNSREETLSLLVFDRIRTEAGALLILCGWAAVFVAGAAIVWQLTGKSAQAIHNEWYSSPLSDGVKNPTGFLIGAAALGILSCTFFLTGYLSLVRRIKAHTLWKNSFCCILCGWLIRVLRTVWRFGVRCVKGVAAAIREFSGNLRYTWKICAGCMGFFLLHWIAIGTGGGALVCVVVLADMLALLYLERDAIGLARLRDGIRRISEGDLTFRIDTGHMTKEHAAMAEDIHAIGAGLDAAVEKNLKSERLKTDLITNVSHDIKTPLTSIINYVELLKQESFDDPKVRHYIEVLENKSQRLKTLTEDVVEASKISSGNISLQMMVLDFAEIVKQASGEYAERFEAEKLQEVQSLPAKETPVRLDGRRTWRILANLYSNAAKYAMPGTRVYTELREEAGEVIFSMKNISEQPLNFSADELTERFIRGDVSRSSEGSGLGLSIARSLTELQGGTFELYLDGDLFKATVRFPTVK